MTAVVAVGLALLAAMLAAIGTVIRQQATTPSGSVGRAWVLGAAVSVSAFAFQVAALVVGTVLLVQPLIVLSVLLELFVQHHGRLLGHRAGRRLRRDGGSGLPAGPAVTPTIAHP